MRRLERKPDMNLQYNFGIGIVKSTSESSMGTMLDQNISNFYPYSKKSTKHFGHYVHLHHSVLFNSVDQLRKVGAFCYPP